MLIRAFRTLDRRQIMIELVLYTRADCELCHEMETLVEQERARFAARMDRIEIDGNSELEERFGQEVPVLFVNGRKAFKYRCTARELRKRLSREVGGRWLLRKSLTS
jgi:glutaredoxin